MKKLVLFVLLLPALALAQSGAFGHGGSSLDLSTLLPIIADSTDWTAGSHVHAIKPKGGKSIEADSGKFGALHVTGITTLDGELNMVTTASESLRIAAGGIRNEGGLRQKGAAIFGATGATATISTAGVVTAPALNAEGTTTATLLNVKQYQTELITNAVDRDFSGAGNWTGTNWAVSGGTLLHTAGSTTAATLAYTNFTASSILAAYPYELTFTVSGMTTGTLTPKLGTYTATAISANGTYTIVINASASNVSLSFTPTSAFDGALDNVSMKYVENAAYVKGGILYHTGIQSVGGNARGVGATDLQVYRTAPTQVASGASSTVSGYSSTASGASSTASGYSSTASGFGCTASGAYSTASGTGSTASGYYSTASGYGSTASGSYSNANLYGSRAHAAGRFAANGDAQLFEVVLRDTTQSSQSDTLHLDGTEVTEYFTISANSAMYFKAMLVAWVVTGADDNKGACYELEGMITRDDSNNTTLVWQSVTEKYEHADLAGLTVTMSADDTNERLNIICAGKTANTIRWVCTVRASQVGG